MKMVNWFYGTSVEMAQEIVEHGFPSLHEDVILSKLPDAAMRTGWAGQNSEIWIAVIEARHMTAGGKISVYEKADELLIPASELASLAVVQCVIYDHETSQPVGLIDRQQPE